MRYQMSGEMAVSRGINPRKITPIEVAGVAATSFFHELLGRFCWYVFAITFLLPNLDIAITRVATIVLTISLKR